MSTADDNYASWSKPALIERIRQLEARGSQGVSTATAPVSSAPSAPSSSTSRKRAKLPPRPFDFSLHSARPIALQIAYLGHNYHGLASQESDTVPTIESHLFDALVTARLVPGRKECGWSRCGRTDRGVSAFEQVCGVWVRRREMQSAGSDETSPLETCWETANELDYVLLLNRLLPADIRVLAWSPVHPTFDARFLCTYRRYKYFFPANGLDIHAMRTACKSYIGTHDFRNFCKIDPAKSLQSYLRTVLHADIRPLGREDDVTYPDVDSDLSLHATTGRAQDPQQIYVFTITGHAFLWHQVRCLTAILLLIGSHLERVSLTSTLLDLTLHPPDAGRPAYDMASEIPLVLVECGYKEGTFRWVCGEGERRRVAEGLSAVWEGWAVRAAQARCLMEKVNPNPKPNSTATEREEYFYPTLGYGPTTGGGGPTGGKRYIPVMRRPRCDSVEVRIEKSRVAKGRKAGGVSESAAAPVTPTEMDVDGDGAVDLDVDPPSPLPTTTTAKRPRVG
ncbi:pseudouridine synthase [Fimicolochytrium jonesii]|uniref:pseudouridine synthase n=1 Tax=Fimicolochytrium jonesii TaxID=1396493 RepID=UPI0022FDB2BC|nr:pseudouridine synthase [Fimicolochytrium jonesii]KAI8815856.1 pseudouridine synthase [Fimicolochytrium jonesii]